jgi:hypothetical protein
MTWLNGFLPTTLIVPFLIYTFFNHEVAEWAHDRSRGMQGSSASVGFFVDVTATIGQFGFYVLLAAYLYDQGWKKTLGLYVVTLAVGLPMQLGPVLVKRSSGGAFLLFRLASLAVLYITLLYICYHLSWFGIWGSLSAAST